MVYSLPIHAHVLRYLTLADARWICVLGVVIGACLGLGAAALVADRKRKT
jgi:hypothetical protein